ncbi:MAG: acetate kinase [Abditibacteriota bacterium]|nr:acetate kinase [Abditibacteriota bacterium]
MKVLVLNSGSSSLKFQLIETENGKVLAKGLCDRIGIDGSSLTYSTDKKEKFEGYIENHKAALDKVFALLTDKEKGVIGSISEIDIAGHRVVHGGEKYSSPVLVTDGVLKDIEELSALAPLHNPANAMGIEACLAVMEGVPQVAVFDTAYHQTMPDYAYMYALPYELYEKYGIRRYGFHGTSHKFVAKQAMNMLEEKGKKPEDTKIVTCHLGNGCSMAAVKGGKVIDTTMGFTPVAGCVMGSRVGDVDPSCVTFLEEKMGLSPAEADKLMNKESGLLGVSGRSSDMRDIIDNKETDPRSMLAFRMFAYRVKKYIGAYAAAMNGLDAVVFTGGVGENSEPQRKQICSDLEYLGIELDLELNHKLSWELDPEKDVFYGNVDLSVKKNGSILRIPTNEELMIATEAVEVVSGAK